METKKLAVVLAAVIVVVVAAVVYMSWDSGEEDPVEPAPVDPVDPKPIPDDNTYGDLMVFGNANNDLYVDQKDIDYIQAVIDGKAAKTPFSDANNDGKVDQKDIDQVKQMIKKADGTKVWFLDGLDRVMPVTWPVDRMVVMENSPQLIALSAGTEKKVVGITKEDPFLYQNFTNAEFLGGINLNKYELVFSKDPDIVVVANGQGNSNAPHHNSSDTITDPKLMSIYEKRGVDIVSLEAMDADKIDASTLTLGYLCGTEKKAMEYYDWCNDLFKVIDDKVKTIPEKDKHTGLVIFGGAPSGGSVSGTDWDYTKAFERAGGKCIADWTGFKAVNAENGTWIFKYDPEFLFRISTIGYEKIAENDDAGLKPYTTARAIFEPMNAVKNDGFYLIDFSLPMNLRIAYMAEVMYPDLFGEGFGDKWHKQLLDIYGLEFDVHGQFVVTPEDYRNA